MTRTYAWVVLGWVVLVAGCGSPESNSIESYRSQILQADLPGQLSSIKDALAMGQQETSGDADAEPLVVAGKIYGGDLSAFDGDKASFTITELPEPGHNHDDPGDCVFCKRRLENADMALVHLVDAEGKVIEIPADRMLGLKSGMNVLAKGQVSRVGDMLVIQATQLCLMDEAQAKSVYLAVNSSQSTTLDN